MRSIFTQNFIMLFLFSGFHFQLIAQQTGNYHSVMVESKTWKRSASGGVSISEYKPFESRLLENFKDFKPLPDSLAGKFGGYPGHRVSSTGFFHTRKIGDRWWVIDPEGFYNLHIAVNSVNITTSESAKASLSAKFGNKLNWMNKTGEMIAANAFNGTGAWSDTEAIRRSNRSLKKPLAYTINLNFMGSYGDKRGGTYQTPGHKGYPNNTIFVFDPGFEAHCNREAKKLGQYADDPNLFGYFSDNEMPLTLQNLEGYLNLKNTRDPGYIAAQKWIRDRGISSTQITDGDREDFLSFAAARYFKIVTNAIRSYDPNHMYLGCRFYASEKNIEGFMTTAGKYLDVVTINYYGAWTPDKIQMEKWGRWTNKAFIITEFYTKGEDSGLGNTSGAGWIVRSQADRGKAYQNFCLGLLESKNCVGWHWFRYQDNDPDMPGAEPSNIDANKGIVDIRYKTYGPMLKLMKQLNENRYRIIEYLDKANAGHK